LPWGLGPDDCIEDAEEAPHARDERNLLWTPPFDQAFVMFADNRVPTGRGERCHVQSVANVSAATGDGSLAAHLPRIAIDRRDTDESSDAATIELAELRQISDQSVRCDIANTRN
jgi:hypothetical protein